MGAAVAPRSRVLDRRRVWDECSIYDLGVQHSRKCAQTNEEGGVSVELSEEVVVAG